ncbi:MAG TPA: hypothetical protein VHC46_06035 [Thermodesulfobacteriota bacterium]|nr:hypothetical protein [Thermodesulfobacteriota bacterium]
MKSKLAAIAVLFALQLFFVPASRAGFSFVPNDLMTTPYGPAYADILVEPTNFLPCQGGPFALCYYAGPEPQTCELTGDGTFANCKCYEIAYGKYFVDINAILDKNIYLETVAVCGSDGSGCQNTNSAPVCAAINSGSFIPGSDSISVFSFDCVPEEGIGDTNCPQSIYAGCMTAPCKRTGEEGIVECSCPTYDGPYQVGLDNQACTLGDDLVWSAAYNPNITGTAPVPPPGGCIPDAPESLGGCPLISSDVPPPPPDVDCGEVCDEYNGCVTSNNVQAGYTCDATLCTSRCNDRNLVGNACSGLQGCDISEIVKLEEEVGCSCCASQICGCEASDKTEHAVYDLNQRQREKEITPQCDTNGTLCGEKKSGSGGGCALASPAGEGGSPVLFILTGLAVIILLRRSSRD